MESRAAVSPRMSRIEDVDLIDDARSAQLYDDAVRRQIIEPGDAGRLRFFALIERAKRCGKNPPALSRLRCSCWPIPVVGDFVSADDVAGGGHVFGDLDLDGPHPTFEVVGADLDLALGG
jgi:hypothetical protein